MDRSVKQPRGGGSDFDESWRVPVVTAGVFGLAEAAGASMRIGEGLYGGPDQDVSVNPLVMSINLMTGDLSWTWSATGGAVTLVAGTAATVAGSVWAWRAVCRKCSALYRDRARIKAEAIDSQAKFMAKGKELATLSRKAVAAKAADLRVQLREGDEPGVLIAVSVADGQPLYGSYEDLHLDIWGPRTGKSTSRVIPAVMEAVGAVVATSNKRDVVDATRAARSTEGRRAWVFDPQGVAAEPCSWYWDPCDWVLGEDGGIGAEERAAELAGHFSAGNESTGDAFFEPEGESLLTGLILAAAVDKRPITQVFLWVTKSSNQDPIDILQEAGYVLAAAALRDQYLAPDKQRGGVFSTAKKMAACLRFNAVQRWVCPPVKGESPRAAFKVADFVLGRDTLYPLSEEGPASAGPLVTALCAAVAGAGKAEGVRHRGGRLPVPLTIVLDEAANIVRWRDLPKQYSHFGSRGIVVMSILQSWAQGVRCWGEDGMKALWSAANIKVIGGGLDDETFLRARSELIGPHYELSTSVSKSKDSRSTSTSRTSEITLHPSDLAALPRGRCVVFSSGNRPTLAATVPWMDRPYAAEISAALDAIAEAADAHQAARPRLRVVHTDQEGKTA